MELECPNCRASVDFADAFDAAFMWAGNDPAVVYKCPRCGESEYFAPRGDHIEVGMLGASPTVDPVPMARYPVAVSFRREGQMLAIEYQGARRELPSSYLYIRDRRR